MIANADYGDAITGWSFGYANEDPLEPPRNARLTSSASNLDGALISSRSVVFDKYNNGKQITETSSVGVTPTRVTVLTYKHEADAYEAFDKNPIGLVTQKTIRARTGFDSLFTRCISPWTRGFGRPC